MRLPIPRPSGPGFGADELERRCERKRRRGKDTRRTIFSAESEPKLDCVNSHIDMHMDTLSISEGERQGEAIGDGGVGEGRWEEGLGPARSGSGKQKRSGKRMMNAGEGKLLLELQKERAQWMWTANTTDSELDLETELQNYSKILFLAVLLLKYG